MQEDNTVIKKMNLSGKYIAVVTLVVLLTISFYAYNEYNRKPADLTNIKPEETITAPILLAAFKNDEEKANKKFLGKNLMVTGLIREINNEEDTLMNIFLGEDNALEKVSCMMDMRKKEQFTNLKIGQQVSLIGFCTGYLQDVEMMRCIIVSSK